MIEQKTVGEKFATFLLDHPFPKFFLCTIVVGLLAFDVGFSTGAIQQRQQDDCHVSHSFHTFVINRDTTWTDTLRFGYIIIYTDPNPPGYESFGIQDSIDINNVLDRAKLLPFTHSWTGTIEPTSLVLSPIEIMIKLYKDGSSSNK